MKSLDGSGPPDHHDANASFSRRHFLELVGIGAMGVTAIGSMVLSAEYLSPNVVKEPPTRFRIGLPDLYPPGSVTFQPEQKIFVVRAKEGYFYALSAVCTHLAVSQTGSRTQESLPARVTEASSTRMAMSSPVPLPGLFRVLRCLSTNRDSWLSIRA